MLVQSDDGWEDWRQTTERHMQYLENIVVAQDEKIETGNRAVARLTESHHSLTTRCENMCDALQCYIGEETRFKAQFQSLRDEIAGEVFYQISQKMQTEVCEKILPDFARTLREEISEAMDAKFNFLWGNMRETTMQVSN